MRILNVNIKCERPTVILIAKQIDQVTFML